MNYENSEEAIVKYNYHLGDSENSEDGEDEKTNSMSGSTCSSSDNLVEVLNKSLCIKEPEKHPGSSSDDDIPSFDTSVEKKLNERQKRRVKTGQEINKMYQTLMATGLSWDEIKEIACSDKNEVEKIRNDFHELFGNVSDTDPIKHETKALLLLMGIIQEPKATHPDLMQ